MKLNNRRLTTEKFVTKAKLVHGEKYNYSKTNYGNAKSKVIIICHKHGEFLQKPDHHLQGSGCQKCSGRNKLTLFDFIQRAHLIHGNKYSYLKSIYKNRKIKLTITCSIHGDFLQTPNDHLEGQGCRWCGINSRAIKKLSTLEEFVQKANIIHGYKYDYSEVVYKNSQTEVIIICSKHDKFEQRPDVHLRGSGCYYCGLVNSRALITSNLNEFIKKAILVHGYKYNYSKVIYETALNKITIVCYKHGEFNQTPNKHLRGQGCPDCNYTISKPETEWLDFLNIPKGNRNKVININNKKFKPDALVGNTIYEFYGDFWHGNPEIFNLSDINGSTKTTYGELYQKTLKKEKILKQAGYEVVSIWESDWNKIKKEEL